MYNTQGAFFPRQSFRGSYEDSNRQIIKGISHFEAIRGFRWISSEMFKHVECRQIPWGREYSYVRDAGLTDKKEGRSFSSNDIRENDSMLLLMFMRKPHNSDTWLYSIHTNSGILDNSISIQSQYQPTCRSQVWLNFRIFRMPKRNGAVSFAV